MQQPYSRRPWRALFLTAGLTAALGSALAQAQAPLKHWDRTIGGNNSDSFAALHPTVDGGYILGGSSQSGVSGTKSQANLGNTDYWVVKIDSTGTKVWDRTIGGSDGENLTCLTLAPDGKPALRKALDPAIDFSIPVRLEEQPRGLYLLRLEGPGGYRYTQRLMLE